MAQWLQAQLNVATNLLESVDRHVTTISKTVGINADNDNAIASTEAPQPGGEPETVSWPASARPLHSAANDDVASRNIASPELPASSAQATPFTIRQRGPFDSGLESTSPDAAAMQPSSNAGLGTATPASATSSFVGQTQRQEQMLPPAAHPAASPAPSLAPRDTPSYASQSPPPALAASTSHSLQAAPPDAAMPPQADGHNNASRPTGTAPLMAGPAPPTAAPAPAPQTRQGIADSAGPPPAALAAAPLAAVPSFAASNSNSNSNNTSGSGGAAKLVEQLRKRLEAATAENLQLEEMLQKEERRAAAEAAAAQRLAEELSALQDTRAHSEASLQSQLAAAQVSSRDLAARLEASNRQVLKLEAEVAALQETAKQLADSRNDLEGGMLEALKSQLEAAEQRLGAEQRAHQSTKAAAMAREARLEGQLGDSGAALADMQRALDEAGTKSRELEDQVALLQATCKQLEQQGGTAGLGPSGAVAKGGHTDSVDAALLAALRTDLSQQQRAFQAAETARKTAEAALSQVKAEADGLRAELEKQAARGDVTQLEARLREVSDMLYLKQNQLERLAADKAAQQLRLERELSLAKEQAAKAGRYPVDRDGETGLPGRAQGDELIPMDALGAHYQRLAQNDRVGKAVKAAARFLDSTASSAVYFLRQYPLARLLIFSYLLSLHLYVYYLMARLQGIAVKMEAVADGVGSLPGHSTGAAGHGVAATELHPHTS